MKLFNSLRGLALFLMIAAGSAFAADAAKPAAKVAKAKTAAKAPEPVKVAYHGNLGGEQSEDILRNVGNHLDADPTAKIVVVTHAKGIQFLLQGTKDSKGNEFAKRVEDLALKGVEFRVCEKTLISGKIDPTRVLPEAKIVPSGVAEIARLQAQEHYSYLKP